MKSEPYQKLFLAALISAILSVSYWVFYYMNWIDFFPRVAHAQLIFFGAFGSFIAGFLLTAVPRMTSTEKIHNRWVNLFVVIIFAHLIFNSLNWTHISKAFFILQNLILFFLVGRSLWQRKQLPFDGFIFLPFAFLHVFAGMAQNSSWLILSGEAHVLNLICGLGSRLIPAFSRLPVSDLLSNGKSWPIMLILAFGLNLTYLFEYLGWAPLGFFLRVVFIVYYMIKFFGFLRKPALMSYLALGLKLALLALPIGWSLSLFFPDGSLALRHFGFIGGLMTLTLMMSTRVTLAHSGAGTDFELTSKSILIAAVLLFFAGVLRMIAGTFYQSIEMLSAATLFILSIFIWIFSFVRWLLRTS